MYHGKIRADNGLSSLTLDSEDDNYTSPNNNEHNDEEHILKDVKKQDKGYNVIYRKNEKKYRKKIEVYTSGARGNRIRDAETGEYSNYLVGSKNEDLFFKVVLATGECKSSNGSNTLFYSSPQHCESHLLYNVSPIVVSEWEEKRNARLYKK